MENTIGIAISGLKSASLRLQASASNISHMRSSGSLTDPDHPSYEAQTTQSTALSGGVLTKIVTKEPATTIAFDPNAVYADENGYVSAPYVSMEEELLTMKMAEQAYKMNAQSIKTAGEMFDTLIEAMEDK
jgi:flagellar basal-body rod protein FlgC